MVSISKKFSFNLPKALYSRKRGDDIQEHYLSASQKMPGTRRRLSHLTVGNDVGFTLVHSSSTGDLCSVTSPSSSLHASMSSSDTDSQTVLLGHQMQRCADSLVALRSLFMPADSKESYDVTDVLNWEEVHRGLQEVLDSLKDVTSGHPSLHSADILHLSTSIIANVKECCSHSSRENVNEVVRSIDSLTTMLSNRCLQLAEKAIAEMLVVDADQSGHIAKAKSLDCINDRPVLLNGDIRAPEQPVAAQAADCLLDNVLYNLENGVEIALHRAQLWSRFVKDLVIFIDKRTVLWTEHARNMAKLAKTLQQTISEDSYLPFHSVFSTAVCQEEGMLALILDARNTIHNQIVITPLNARRVEHDKVRKNLKYVWSKQLNKMHDAMSNLRKAKSLYVSRQQEYDKLNEQATRAETESLSLVVTGNASVMKADARAERKKRQEEEALQKAIEAEASYKACIQAANSSREQLNHVKMSILRDIRELLKESDEVLKLATVGYFNFMNESTLTLPLKYRALCEASQLYQPGSHYASYVRHLRPADNTPASFEAFIFEPYVSRYRDSSGSTFDSCEERFSSLRDMALTKQRPVMDEATESDIDSDIDDSLSMDSSPFASPRQIRAQALITSASAFELASMADDDSNGTLTTSRGQTYRGVRLSTAAQSHVLHKLHSPSRCVECGHHVYFQGAECEQCGITVHKKCLEILHCTCDRGPASNDPVKSADTAALSDHVPHLVTQCIAEIDKRGLTVKGIYRVSGVKSQVELLCQSFETDEQTVDLSQHQSNVVANVLKFYFRQMSEPLLTFNLYAELISLAREELQGSLSAHSVVAALRDHVNDLSTGNRLTLMALISHLNRVARQQDINQMSAANLGIIFGPTLLRPRQGASSLNYLIETPFQTRIVELLINNVEAVFGVTEERRVCDDLHSDLTALSSAGDCQVIGTSPTITSWYAPETTQDLLQELAQEVPHFQQLQTQTSPDSAAASSVPVITDDVTRYLDTLQDDTEGTIYYI